MQRRIIPDIVKDQQICALSEDSTLYAAAKQMVDSNVTVVDGSEVVGRVSIRDLYTVVTGDLAENIHQTEAFVFGA